MTDLPELATPKEVALYLRTTEHKVKNLCIRGDMRFIKVGRDKLIKREFVKEFLKENEQCQKEQQHQNPYTGRTGETGISSNTGEALNTGLNQVLTALKTLNNGSRNTHCGKPAQEGRVIPMNARS